MNLQKEMDKMLKMDQKYIDKRIQELTDLIMTEPLVHKSIQDIKDHICNLRKLKE